MKIIVNDDITATILNIFAKNIKLIIVEFTIY
jgi:hypothetical protein